MTKAVAPTLKRKQRVIYMSDVEWKALAKAAKQRDLSMSELIRDSLGSALTGV